MVKLVLRENRDLKVMKEQQETKEMLVMQESPGLKERSVPLVSPAKEVQREVEVSRASRDLPAHPGRGACRATGVYQGPEDPRGQRAKSQVISTSSKFVCASCKNSWLSWLPVCEDQSQVLLVYLANLDPLDLLDLPETMASLDMLGPEDCLV